MPSQRPPRQSLSFSGRERESNPGNVLFPFESAQPRDPRPRQVIEYARAWVRDQVTMTQADQRLRNDLYWTAQAPEAASRRGSIFACR
ncbi:putative immunity protein [Arthrobacter sp. H14-L1]|uniref:putative immunity protein n=1 Tax=Arthrobacter sp. H14-L1 TaxID=2996697 RepID=UPI002D1E3FF3|nr:hypothetical protein [Arthrobacter sp. H14-L1]